MSSQSKRDSLIHTLVEDVEGVLQRLREQDSERNRRDAIRTTFAGIEGAHWIAKSGLLEFGPHLITLSIHEIACLREESFLVNERGIVKPQPKFIPIRTSIKQITGVLKRLEPDYELDLSHPAWGYLHNSVKVRNRITHPRTRTDLRVTMEEVSEAVAAFNWMLAFTIETLWILHQTALTTVNQLENDKPKKPTQH